MKPPSPSPSAVIIGIIWAEEVLANWVRKAQYPMIELVAQSPQHALAELAFIGVDGIFEAAIDENESQKYSAQYKQIADLVKFKSEQFLREMTTANGVIDNRFWQVERDVKKWKG